MESSANRQGSGLRIWGWKVIIVLLAGLWLALVATSWAEAATSEGGGSPSVVADDDYNFSWLDPDKKIYVLQNRRYTKANKVELSLLGGLGLSNTYRSTRVLEGRAAYYFSEAMGLEFFLTGDFNSSNNALQALQGTNVNVSPVIRDITSEYGVLLDWVPWYAKINVFNNILYFDWYFSGGIGGLSSTVYSPQTPNGTAQSNFAGFFGTGHQYHLSQQFLVRLDLTGAVYRDPIYGTTGANSWYTNFNFTIGVGLKL